MTERTHRQQCSLWNYLQLPNLWGRTGSDTTEHTTGAEMAIREGVRKMQSKQQRGRRGARRGRSEDHSGVERTSFLCDGEDVSVRKELRVVLFFVCLAACEILVP